MSSHMNAALPIEQRVDALLAEMTLAEKIGQMTQVEKDSINSDDIASMGIGSILSGGGGYPEPNTPAAWADMVRGFQEQALQSRLGIPLLYGVDAVHGHNNLAGATIFPHNVGLGATQDADLVERVARATALELAATQIRWNFAPAVPVPQDVRWGRSYEGLSQDTALVAKLGAAYVRGLLGDDLSADTSILPSVKHYIGDGATTWGTSKRLAAFIGENSGEETSIDNVDEDATLANAKVGNSMQALIDAGAWQLDQGESHIDEETLRRVHLPPYIAALEAGALNVMASFSSWGGEKMHANKYLLTDVLKGELGFSGFIVSDWEGFDQVDPDFYKSVAMCVNAGMDMNMVPYRYVNFIETLTRAVENGDIAMGRIDDAVRRILRVKMIMGLFEAPHTSTPISVVGCDEHRALAREAVRKSLIALKGESTLPLAKDAASILVTGVAANDIGYQCGGWTIDWMGSPGAITPGTTILDGITQQVSEDTAVEFSADGESAAFSPEHKAPLGIAVLAEEPYAEGMGDRRDLRLTDEHAALIEKSRARCEKLVVILLSGRPRIVTEQMDLADLFLAAWLPGTEGDGITDVLFGDHPLTGVLSYEWPE